MFYKANLFLIFLVSFSSLGQNSSFEVNPKTGFLFFGNAANEKTSSVEGSPYIDSRYYASQVSGYSGPAPQIRYNAYKDEMEFVEGGKTYYVIKKDSLEIKSAIKSYVYLEYPVEKGDAKGYLVALAGNNSTKFVLYKKEKVILIPEYDSGSGYRDAVPAHFKIDEDKFYFSFSGKVVMMPKKEKELLALFPDQSEDLKKFIKENKTSFKKQEDLTKLVNYMNTK